MAAAPASAAAALALLVATTGKIKARGFDLGQIVGATNDASCLMLATDKSGAIHIAMFISAATASAGAGVLAIAQNFESMGISCLRYVISTTELQLFTGTDAAGTFVQQMITPTDVEWIDAMRFLLTLDPHA
jgi:hypothetical protein